MSRGGPHTFERIVWGVLIAAILGVAVWEVRRWQDPDSNAYLDDGHKRRAISGLALLLTIAGMGFEAVGFQRRPVSRLVQAEEAVHYGAMMLLVIGVLLVVYLDWRAALRRLRTERRKALEETLDDLAPRIVGGGEDGDDGR